MDRLPGVGSVEIRIHPFHPFHPSLPSLPSLPSHPPSHRQSPSIAVASRQARLKDLRRPASFLITNGAL